MTVEAREELIEAVRSDRIENATRFAQEFAQRHGLNPTTVRSTISRLRREEGLLKRHPGGSGGQPTPRLHMRVLGDISPMTFLKLGTVTDPTLTRVGAAVLVRYEEDPEFRREVDEQRPDIERLHAYLKGLRELSEELSPDEREELARLIES
jgi:hypothetical protein